MAVKSERLSGPERKQQIIQAAISIMAGHGLSGATTRLIAEEVGVSEPALYKYFPGKKELLLDALEEVASRFFTNIAKGAGGDAPIPDRIYNMSASFYEFVMEHHEESVLLFETVTGARDPEVKAKLSDKMLQSITVLSAMFDAGKEQGSVREDLDTTVAAWQIMSLGITLVFAALTGLEGVLTREKALLAVKEVLDNIVMDASACGGEGIATG